MTHSWLSFQLRLSALVTVILIIVFENGAAHMVGTNPYRRLEHLDSQGKYVLEWQVDRNSLSITFNVTAETRGYVGFGLSAKGKMSGADIVIGGVLSNGDTYFSDRHAVSTQVPVMDPSQDWFLHQAWENSTHTFLSFSRAWGTCDPQDYAIVEDKVSLIWAYGERDQELDYHYGNRGEFPVHLLNPDYTPPIDRDRKTNAPLQVHSPYNENVHIWTWDIPHIMSSSHTSYWCTLHKVPAFSKKHQMIGYEVRVNDEQSRKHLHHIIINKCRAPQGFSDYNLFGRFVGQKGFMCYGIAEGSSAITNLVNPLPYEYCRDPLQIGGIGGRINFMPPHVGAPFGDTVDEYYLIYRHYDNPAEQSGILVNVSLDVYYTPQIRKHEGGVMVIRQETPGLAPSHLIPPSSVAQKTYAICGGECLTKMLPKEGIRIYDLLLHGHRSAVGMRLRHFRGNQELPFIAREDNYAFDYQQMRTLPKEVHVLPGDQLVVDCTTDNTWTNGTVVGGFSTRQEMCDVGFFYYNRLEDYIACASEINAPEFRESFLGIKNMTWSMEHLEYVVQSPRKLAGLAVSKVANMINWTIEKRQELNRFLVTYPHTNRCPRELYARAHTVNSDGEPVDLQPEESLGMLVSLPMNASPYIPTEVCSKKRKANVEYL